MGAGERSPIARNDKIEIVTVMSVTLTCDHRAVDGAIAAEWLSAFKALIDDPLMMIV